MLILRSNGIRIKRFRELKADLRTNRNRLLVGIDIAKAQHVAQVRLAHTRILDLQLGIPNTEGGFAAFWGYLQRRQQETGCIEIVCALEPPGTYHQALATFLEGHGADVVLVAPRWPTTTAARWTAPGGRPIPRMPTTSGISSSGGMCSFTRCPMSRPRRSAVSCASSGTPGWSSPRARSASG